MVLYFFASCWYWLFSLLIIQGVRNCQISDRWEFINIERQTDKLGKKCLLQKLLYVQKFTFLTKSTYISWNNTNIKKQKLIVVIFRIITILKYFNITDFNSEIIHRVTFLVTPRLKSLQPSSIFLTNPNFNPSSTPLN